MTRPTVGWELWSRRRGYAGVDDGGDQIEPVGGVCVFVTERLDEETGAIEECYVVIDRHHGYVKWCLLAAAEVNAATARPATERVLVGLWRHLAADIANRRRGHSRPHPSEAKAGRAIIELQGLVFGEGNRYAELRIDAAPQLALPRPTARPNVEALID